MGVVFGDIGTSPLYTVSVTLKASSSGGTVAPEAVLGIVSLIFWSLIVVISIKYALLIMRADNHGEGGILALLALISPRRARQSRRRAVMVVIGLLGATLLWRWRNHAGDFGSERDRRPQGLCAADGARDRAADGGYPGFAVCGPAQGHLVHRRHFRAGDAGLVHRHRPPRHRGHCASAGHPCCAQSVPGDYLSLELKDAGCGPSMARSSWGGLL